MLGGEEEWKNAPRTEGGWLGAGESRARVAPCIRTLILGDGSPGWPVTDFRLPAASHSPSLPQPGAPTTTAATTWLTSKRSRCAVCVAGCVQT